MLLDTPTCDFGWKAPDFTLQDIDGNRFSMREQLGDKGLLIAFICNHCPYVQRIAERLAQDTDLLMAEGINVLAVMSNDYQSVPADSPEKMKVFAKKYGFNFPYLVDEEQLVGQAYGAICTPDFFGLNCHGELQYRGRLDDAGMGQHSGRVAELINAMRMIAETGVGPKEQHPSMGCSIKWRDTM
ncbi:thioredoxin family protein [Corallincola luteus]|uniref:Thioredoxin family protein n=1 Tax=Corallincola luteus TaxID=1775177 RepID=A0ABY2AFI3_9GAMM|nr:thioredoxin family protein [Corallincola luteus]TCI01170.1 thioredoxin family protein [Corallincola luteus]